MGVLSSFRWLLGSVDGFAEIKKAADKFALRRDHRGYERVLTKYDADIAFEGAENEGEFVGSGKGQFTLNSYRKLLCKEGALFEKIYCADSLDWRKCQFFYAHVYPGMGGLDVRVPALRWHCSGRRLAIARFEYAEFKQIDIAAYLDEVLRISGGLASLGPNVNHAPEEFLDLSRHFGFERCYQKSLSVFGRNDGKAALLQSMRKRCEALPRFIAHGDLSRPNMGGGGLVLDWDNFGFYPPGFDLALALVLTGDLLGADELADFARQGHEAVKEHCTFENFWFSLVFLYATFLSARKAEHKSYCFGLLESEFLASSRQVVVLK